MLDGPPSSPKFAGLRLEREFFARPTLETARAVLGTRLVRRDPALGGRRLSALIVEAEAYIGQGDLGCHARSGRTARTAVMFGPPGHAYVYFTYGMHWMLNFVTEADGLPAAMLIRAVLVQEGLEAVASRRDGQPLARWTDGPAKLCRAFNIDGSLNGHDLCSPAADLWVEAGLPIPDSAVTSGPRVGLYTVPEPWKSIPWRLRLSPEGLETLRQGGWNGNS